MEGVCTDPVTAQVMMTFSRLAAMTDGSSLHEITLEPGASAPYPLADAHQILAEYAAHRARSIAGRQHQRGELHDLIRPGVMRAGPVRACRVRPLLGAGAHIVVERLRLEHDVETETGVLRPDELHDMIEMPEHGLAPDRIVAQIDAGAGQTDQPAGGRASPNLLVRHIAEMRPERVGVGMAEDRRLRRLLERLDRGPAAGVAEVEQHPHPLNLGDEPPAEAGEPSIARFGAAATGRVGLVEGKQGVAHAEPVERLHQVEIAFKAARALEMQQHGELAGAASLLDPGDAVDEARARRRLKPAAGGSDPGESLAAGMVVAGDRERDHVEASGAELGEAVEVVADPRLQRPD